MKHFLLGLILVAGSFGGVRAQMTLRKESFPRVGDTLHTAVDNLPGNLPLTGPGSNQRWDFSMLQAPFTRRTLVRRPDAGEGAGGFPSADLMVTVGENLEGYFEETSTELRLLGFYGTDPLGFGVEVLTRFRPPLPERRAPLRFQDVHQAETDLSVPFAADDLPSQTLDQFPITPDSLRIRIHIDRQDVVDAWGKIIIPGGIYDVLRERRIETRTTRLDAKLGFLPWQDITDLVPIESLGELTTVTYYYFSNEAKEPVAVVYLDETEENVLRVEFKSNELSTDVQNIANLKPGVYAFPNPAIVHVRFEFSNLPAGEYTLTMYNILGVEVWRQRYFIQGSRTEKVNITGLRKGTYLYSLTDDRGKTLTTKRLMVIKP